MNYNLLRIHQSYYHRVGAAGHLYAGAGYFLDARWHIRSVDQQGQPVAAIAGYPRGIAGRSTSSGLVASGLRDTRASGLRPAAGESYLFLALRANMQALGSDQTYRCGATCGPGPWATCWLSGSTATWWWAGRRPTSTCLPRAGTRTA